MCKKNKEILENYKAEKEKDPSFKKSFKQYALETIMKQEREKFEKKHKNTCVF